MFGARGDEVYNPLNAPVDYNKIKVGPKNLDDAILNLGSLKKSAPGHPYTNKGVIYQAIIDKDYQTLREISNFYYDISGIYERVCNYFAFLYRYDWYVVPDIKDDTVKEEKVLKDFSKVLNYLDNSYVKKMCGDIALEVIKNGCYYGYVVENGDCITLQQLPPEYCRSRYYVNGVPAIEFNMRFFDRFADPGYRMKVLNLFPDEFKKGYMLFKQGKLTDDITGERTTGFYTGKNTEGWYLLDPTYAIKFNFNNSDSPLFVNAIPAIIDLDQAQDLDRRKQMQKLLKIVVQKLPMDKNGDLIFDIDEARDIHNNAVEMLKRAVGVDVITTFADVDSIDMSDKNTTTSKDDLEKVERTLFNSLGISQNLFNTDGNLSLEKSILNDESSVRNLLLQFQMFFDKIVRRKGGGGSKYSFKMYLLETTQYNYKELAKLYKEQTQLGYSKMLPQIALGHSQSFILNSVCFENDILHLSQIMIPPLMSSTLNGQDIQNLGNSNKTDKNNTQKQSEGQTQNQPAAAGQKKVQTETKAAGRPEKADDQKSEKTIQNKESMS